jgi:hypothetical protein
MQRDGIVKRIEGVVYPRFICGHIARALPGHGKVTKRSGMDTVK